MQSLTTKHTILEKFIMRIITRIIIGLLFLPVLHILHILHTNNLDSLVAKNITKNKTKKMVKNTEKPSIISVNRFGMWYPGTPSSLKKTIRDYLQKVPAKPNLNNLAVIAPHAGYKYSGQTAAYAFKSTTGKKYQRIVVLGPSHHYRLHNKIAMPTAKFYKTPLGKTKIDRNFIKKLLKLTPHAILADQPFTVEHSVDNEIPFVQYTHPEAKIVPIIVGMIDADKFKMIGQSIRSILDKQTLLVISSDFTHYGRNFSYVPFSQNIKENLRQLDQKAVKAIATINTEQFLRFTQKTGATICGAMPIALLLSILPPNTSTQILRYDTSGDLLGNFNSSVSYYSIGFTGKWPSSIKKKTKPIQKQKPTQKTGGTMNPTEPFPQEAKKGLIRLARQVLESYIKDGKKLTFPETGLLMHDIYNQKRGAFVTLNIDGHLRGCIGEILPRRKLYQVIIDRTVDAAVNDSRFPPVIAAEVPSIDIEISVLAPPQKVESYKDIIIGTHGIILSKRGRGAVYLPQVATEQGWDIETTLSHLSRKAGFSHDAWRSDTQFEVFTAIVFHEEKSSN